MRPAAGASIEWTLFCSVSTKQLAAGGNDGGEFTQANAIRVAGLDRIFCVPSFALRLFFAILRLVGRFPKNRVVFIAAQRSTATARPEAGEAV